MCKEINMTEDGLRDIREDKTEKGGEEESIRCVFYEAEK